MINTGPVLFLLGALLTTLAGAMCVPVAADGAAGGPDDLVFLATAAATLFVGVSLILTNRPGGIRLSLRQAFLFTATSWVVLAGFAALPLWFSRLGLSYTDRKSTRLNSSHIQKSRMPSSA